MSEFGNRVTSWKAVEIDGEKIATPSHQGVQISRNLIQSAKTRRTANGNKALLGVQSPFDKRAGEING